MQINQYQSLLTKCEYIEAVSDSLIKNIENQEQQLLINKKNLKLKPTNQFKLLEQKENLLSTNIVKLQQLQLKQRMIQQNYQFQIQQAYLKIRKLKQQKSQIGKIKHQKINQNKTCVRMAKQLKQLQKQLFNQKKLLNLQIKNDNSLKQNNLQVLQSISKAQRRLIQLKKIQESSIQAQKQHIHFKSLEDKYEKLAQKKQVLLFESTQSWEKINIQSQNKVSKIGDIINHDQEMNQYITKLITKIKEQQFVIQQIQKRETDKLSQFYSANEIVEEEEYSQQDDDYFKHQIENLRKTIANRKFNQRIKLFNQQKRVSLAKEHPHHHQNEKIGQYSEYLQHPKRKKFSESSYHNPFQKQQINQHQNINSLKSKVNLSITPKRKISNKNNDGQIFKISVQPISHSKNIKLKSQGRESQREQKHFNNKRQPKIDQYRREHDYKTKMRMDEQELYKKKKQFLQKINDNPRDLENNTNLNRQQYDYVSALLEQKQEELMKLSKVETKMSHLKPFKYSPLYRQNQKRQHHLDNNQIQSRLITQPLSIKYNPFQKLNSKKQNTSSDLFGKTRSQIMNKLKSRIRIRTRQTEQQKQKQVQLIKKINRNQKSSRSSNVKQRKHTNEQNRNQKSKKKIINQKKNISTQVLLNNQDEMPKSIYNSMDLNIKKNNEVYAQKTNIKNESSSNTTASNLKMVKYKNKIEDIISQDDKVQSLLAQLKRLKQSEINFLKREQKKQTRASSQRSNIKDQQIQVFKFSKNRKSRINSANKSKGKIQQRESGGQQQQIQESLQKIEEEDESIKNTINYI